MVDAVNDGDSLLAALVERMPEGVAIFDRSSRVSYANAATARMFGRTVVEMTGQLLWEMFPEAIGNPFHEAFQRVAAGGPPAVFDHDCAPLGRWFSIRIELHGDKVHVVARDVTEELRGRRRIEALARTASVFALPDVKLATAMQALAQEISALFSADCSIRLVSADGSTLDRIAVAPPQVLAPELLAATARIPIDSPLCGAAVRTQLPTLWVHGDASLAYRGAPAAAAPYGPAALIIAPLIASATVIGAVFIGRHAGLAPLTDDDRQLAGEIAMGVGLYVSRAQRQDEAMALEQRLASLADALPALVAFVDRDRRYSYVNASYERWFGLPRSAFLGRPVEEILGADGYAAIAPHIDAALAGTAVRFRTQPASAGGDRVVDASYEPIRSQGEVIGLAVLVLDVTAETRLANAERRRFRDHLRAAERMDRLLGIAARLAAAQDSDEVARAVVEAASDALDASLAAMWLVSEAGDELVLRRSRGFPAGSTEVARIPLVGGVPAADCVILGEPVWITSRADYAARYPAVESQYRPSPPRPISFGCVPICVEDNVIGALMIGFNEEPRLGQEERVFLEVVASHASDALRRARLYAELLEASETREAMIGASPAAIMLLDATGVVLTWNPAAERIFGWKADEVLGKFHPSVPDSHREWFMGNLEKVIGGAVMTGVETRRLRASGEWFDVELYAAPVRRATGETLCLAMVVDSSERKRVDRGRKLVATAATELARSLEWEQLTARVVELVVEDFADWCCVDLLEGDQLRRIAHSRSQDGAAMPITVAHAPERGGSSAAIATGSTVLVPDIDDGYIRRLARNPEHEAAIRASGIRSLLAIPLKAGQRAFGAFSFGARNRNFDKVDIGIATELANQTAMAIDNARLYQQAQEARRDAETANLAKDQFLAMLGHELRNPLAPISTALELMKTRAPEQSREREIIGRQVSHLTRLVDDLLDVSRISRGTVELERTRLPVASFVGRAVELARPMLDKHLHNLTISVPDDLVVDGDATRLAQIVSNLLTNAARYSDPGASTVVSAVRDDRDLILRVTDSGIGIAPEELPAIFDAFVQGPQALARTTGGLGLGLTIVKNLVELHGGCVVARSEGLGKGTEIEVRLPLAAGEATAEIPIVARGTLPPLIRRRVLIVDDNQDAAVLLAELLDGEGHEIRTAFDATTALAIAEEFRPDIAVLDLGLPLIDGYELARRLRENPAHSRLRLIALTGYSQPSDRARSLNAGFDRHLAKPVAIDTLIQLVANL